MFGRFIGAVDASEVFELAGTRLFIQALHIARFGDLQRRIDEDFHKFALG